MKTAFYIEDGREQIVLTPETEFEKNVLRLIHTGERQMSLKQGQFYECNGGWVRQGDQNHDRSTIIILDKKPVAEEKT
jgi:hypothetical protein